MKMQSNLERSEREAMRVEKDLNFMRSAIPTQTAAQERIAYIEATPEPLEQSDELWHTNEGCCTIS